MKHSNLQTLLCACLLFACISVASAQSEIGIRPLFFQNDFTGPTSSIDGTTPGPHAGEWQLGVSGRTRLTRHCWGRLEANLTHGRYSFSNARFAYLSFCAIPEWRVKKNVFIGTGASVNTYIKDPFDAEQTIAMGFLADVGIRHGHFEFHSRLQGGLGSPGKIALGAGLDYFFSLKKKSRKERL